MSLTDKQIPVLKAQEFRIASVSTQLYGPRMFILLFFHKDLPTFVRTRVIFRKDEHSSVCWPEFSVETIDCTYEVLEAAKKTFEDKAIFFINRYRLRETVTNG